MLQIQLDTRCEIFEFYRNLALEALSRVKPAKHGKQSEQALRAWDGHMNSDSKGIALLIGISNKISRSLIRQSCRSL